MRDFFTFVAGAAGFIGGIFFASATVEFLSTAEPSRGIYILIQPIMPLLAYVFFPVIAASVSVTFWAYVTEGIPAMFAPPAPPPSRWRVLSGGHYFEGELECRYKLMSKGEVFTLEIFREEQLFDHDDITYEARLRDDEGEVGFPIRRIEKSPGRTDWIPEDPDNDLMIFTDLDPGNPYATYKHRIWQAVPWDDWREPICPRLANA